MKKVLSLMLVLLLAVTALPMTANADYTDHTHVFEDEIWYEPTCTSKGYKERFCIYCDYAYGVEMKALGHYYPLPWTTVKEPTCTEEGIEHNVCQRSNPKTVICGFEWYRPIPALGHDFGEWTVVKEPTVNEEGIERRYCSRCDEYEERPIDKLTFDGNPAIEMTLIASEASAPAVPGTVLHYQYIAENTGDALLHQYEYECKINETVAALDDITGSDYFGPGEQASGTFTVTLTQEMCDAGYVDVFFGLICSVYDENNKGIGINVIDFDEVTTELYEEAQPLSLSLEARFTNMPEGGYYADDYAYIAYTVTNTGTEVLPIISVYLDSENFPTGSFGTWAWENPTNLVPGESYSSYFCVDLTSCSDWAALGNSIDMTVHASAPIDGENSQNGVVSAKDVHLSSPIVVEDYALKITYAFPFWSEYAADDVVTFEFGVKNTGKNTLYDVCIRPEWDEYGDPLNIPYNSVISLNPGEVLHGSSEVDLSKLSYVPADHFTAFIQAVGCQVQGLNESDPALEVYDMTDVTVAIRDEDYEEGDMEIWIEKTELSTPIGGPTHNFYTPGEEIEFGIEVWNCVGYPLYDVNVYDEYDGTLLMSIPELAPHAAQSEVYRYKVTYDDVGTEPIWDAASGCYRPSAYFENTAYVMWNNGEVDPDTGDINVDILYSDTVECPLGLTPDALMVGKEEISTPANGSFYTPGEVIEYKITVTENQGKSRTGFTVVDENHDKDIIPLTVNSTIDPHETAEFYYSYTVTEEAIESPYFDGNIYNVAEASVYSPGENENDEESVMSNWVVSPAGRKNNIDGDNVVLTKFEMSTPENGEYYMIGETVRYAINVWNASFYPVYDFELSDPIAGDNEDAILELGETIDGYDTRSYVYEHIVTKEDAALGMIINYATAWYYDSYKDQYMQVTSDDVIVPVELLEPEIEDKPNVYKRLLNEPANGSYFTPGEVVKLGFIVDNWTDNDYVNGTIYDDFLDIADYWEVITGIEVPAHSITQEYILEITVDENDADRESGLNDFGSFFADDAATGESIIATSEPVYVPTGRDLSKPEQQVSVIKQILNTPANGEWFTEDEVIHYAITVNNASDYPLYNASITDNMFNDDVDFVMTVETLAYYEPHTAYPYLVDYTVTKGDAECGYITDMATLWFEADFDELLYHFECSNSVTALTGPGEAPHVGKEPYMYKFVSNTPKNGQFYTEDEEIEFTLVVVNTTDLDCYNLVIYDMLSEASDMSVPCATTVAAGDCVTATMTYKVTDFDVTYFEKITNFAWAMLENDVAGFVAYSNECDAPIGDGTPTPKAGAGKYCSHELVGHGDAILSYATNYCAVHGSVEEAARKIIESVEGDTALIRAYEVAAYLWKEALNKQYDELIMEAEAELSEALNADQNAFASWYEKYSALLDADSEDTLDAAKAKYEAVRKQCCELCCIAGTAPATPSASVYNHNSVINTAPAEKCEVKVESSAYRYTETYIACSRLSAILKDLNAKVNEAANETEASRAWESATGFGMTMLSQYMTEAADGLSNKDKILYITEQNSFKMMLNTRRAVLGAFYPENPETAAELLCSRVLEEVCLRCTEE